MYLNMKQVKRVVAVYFSPTGNNRKIIRTIAKGFNVSNTIEIDLTLPEGNKNYKGIHDDFQAEPADVVIVASPAYNGRVPGVFRERLARIKGCGGPLVIACTYGRISYGDVFQEIGTVMKNNHFVTVALGSFVGYHSWSNTKRYIGYGRPNYDDLLLAEEFGNACHQKISKAYQNEGAFSEEGIVNMNNYKTAIITLSNDDEIPGKFHDKLFRMPLLSRSKPTADCVKCNTCVDVCPTGAIRPVGSGKKELICDPKKCLHCYACVRACPHDARVLKDPVISIITYFLSKKYSR
ncbi:MAG: 4Fe-4S binding protein [Bacteroidales bacterium]